MANEKGGLKNPIVTKSFSLALEIVSFSAVLRNDKHFDLASQLFRSGTSIGANVRESQGAESRADFIHKMKVAFKESEELEFWIELCQSSDVLPNPPKELGLLLNEVRRLLSSIIASSKRGQ